MTDREVLKLIVDLYDMRSEIYTNDAFLAADLAERARKALETKEEENVSI